MIRKSFYIACLLLFGFSKSSAQNSELWTMSRCMKYAVEHSIAVQKKSYEAANYKADYQNAVRSFFPKINAEISGQYNWGRSIDPSTNTYNTVTTFNNFYNLYSSVYLFEGGQIINQFRQAKINRSFGLNEIQKSKDDKAIEVMQAFVDAAYYKECIKLAEEKLSDSRQLLLKTGRQEELGMKGRPDVAQIKAQVAEDDYNLTHQQNIFNSSILKLKDCMNYPTKDSLDIEIQIERLAPQFRIENIDDIYQFASTNNPMALSAQYNIQKARYQHNINKGMLMPSLSLQAGVATSYYKNLSDGGTNIPFSTQFENNRGEYVGVVLSIPLFNGSSYGNIRKSKNNILIAQLDKDETMRKLHSDIEQAMMDRNGYVKEIVQMENKVGADSLAYYVAHRKYEEGMVSALELHTTSSTLLQSKITLLQKRMLFVLKDKLIDYYKGQELY